MDLITVIKNIGFQLEDEELIEEYCISFGYKEKFGDYKISFLLKKHKKVCKYITDQNICLSIKNPNDNTPKIGNSSLGITDENKSVISIIRSCHNIIINPIREICAMLHEYGHHLSFINQTTRYKHKNDFSVECDYENTNCTNVLYYINKPNISLEEEFVAWTYAFQYLSKLKLEFLYDYMNCISQECYKTHINFAQERIIANCNNNSFNFKEQRN
jgi:hypothetical protein